jgi:hypothetical protein
MKAPTNLQELVDGWKSDLLRLDGSNSQEVAYDIVGRLTMISHTPYWDEWYKRNPLVAEIFDLAGDLELPPAIYIAEKDRPKTWIKVKELIKALEESLTDI